MQINGQDSELQSEINITPLVDVVLVLLIIFMVVVPLLLHGYDAEIPRASADAPPSGDETQIIMAVSTTSCPILVPPPGDGLPADCRVGLGGQEIPASEIPARVAELLGGRPPEQRVLFFAADARLNYEAILRIVDLAKSQVDDLKIAFIAAN